jgi:Icc-related predicted phosphoesterase
VKILALSDEVVEAIYSPQVVDLYGDVDLVVGCGDLPYYYLEYVAAMLQADVVYVYGNHDRTQYMSDGRIVSGAEGCIPIDGRSLMINGILIAGLGGSMRYQPNAINQYTEDEMRLRIFSLIPQLLANRLRYGRYLDILVTHAPPRSIHDGSDLTHLGFKAFLTLMRYARPRYLLHGHKHVYRQDRQQETVYMNTTVANVYPSRVIEWD